MRNRLSLVMAMVIALTALLSAPRAERAGALALDSSIPPQVVETAPAHGEELPVDGSVTFYFDEPMDHASVEAAFSTLPVLKGALGWPSDSTATFKPSTPLNRATDYTFVLNATAKSQAGATLKDTFTLKLRTGGNLAVSQILPADGAKDVEATPTITVIFTRPVVPLGTVEQMAKLPSPISLTPSADGQGEWLNTSIYTFKPNQLQGGTRYTITVHKGLTDVTGAVLQSDVNASFTTVSPRVIDITPNNNATQVLRDAVPVVTFSQPMDTAATQGAFSLVPVPKGQAVQGDFTWNDKHDTLTFKPKALLDYGQNYTLKIDATKARSASGGLLQGDATSLFETVSKPDIIATDPGNGDAQAQPYGGFEVRFSAPMQLKDYKSHVTIDPKPGAFYDDLVDDNGFYFRIGFGTEPSTTYTITIDPKGLVDVYGTPLTVDPKNKNYNVTSDGKIRVTYTTAAYPPEASLQTGGFIGLYSAYNPQTRVYSTHRNISQIELSLYSVSVKDFISLSGSNAWDFRNKYAPQTFLRRWNVPVANPTNVLRYDLLAISDQGPNLGQQANVTCPGAPPAHIHAGDTVVVLRDDPTPQRVRDSAGLTGNIVTTLKPGAVLHVVSGPICSDKYLWWQVTTGDGSVTGWTAEGDPTRYFIGPPVGTQPGAARPTPTQASQAQSNAPAAGTPLKAGFYWLEFNAPELPDNQGNINHLMIVATANVTLKVAQRSVFAWVTDLQSGKPVANVNVQFYQNPTAQLGTAKTDANGVALIALPSSLDSLYSDIYALVNDGTNFGASVSDMTDGIEPFDFSQDTNFYPQDVTVYMYTDRALYRPDQPVYFRGVVRSRDDVTYSLSNLKSIPVKVVDDQDKTVFQKDEPLTAFGTFADSFTLDTNAALGYYRVVANPPSPANVANPPEFSQGFNVADYRLPEFKVTTRTEQPQVVQGDKIKVKVDSAYFFGGAVSNADVSWSVTTSPYYFNYNGTGSYSFVDFNEDAGPSEGENPNGNTLSEGKGKTDAQGQFTIEVPADLGKTPQSQTFTVEARVTDESAQVVAGRSDVIVNQGQFYIGVTPEQYVGTAGQAQKVDLISVGWDSKPMSGQDLAVKVVERVWSSVQTVEPGTGRTVWTYDVKENPITDGTVHTDQDGKGVFTFTPPHGGDYKIYATSRDSRGNQITSSAFDWIAGPDYVPWRQENSNRIELKLDKTDYKIGDVAQVLIASPFQGEATALVSVERGKMLKAEVISMTSNSTIYKLPITPDMAPNAYVSVMIVKGVDAKNPVAAFRMGLSQIGVETERLKLNIQISSDKAQAGPRDKVNYTLHVTDYKGNPVQAEVGLAMVDEAALSLLPDQSTPILDHFYGKQGLGIRTSSTLTQSVDQQTQQIINTIKGGGGGGPETGIFTVRQEFITTPVWSPTLTTDSGGNATLTVTLPDNLTTWKLDARAVTQPTGDLHTTLVGQTTSELLSTKPLLIRPVTPRFFVAGDSSTLSAVVNNNTDQAQDVTVRVEVTG
ncbi:MAG TPA: Ig-like domain-containing protein, partial [Aggregatilineales bacterium]|nr:Ig-like domain-containing protein [Aggregatilineales bacterium]